MEKIHHKVHHGNQTSWKHKKLEAFTPNRSRCKLFEDIPGSTALLLQSGFLCTINTWDAINIALEASCYCSANSIFLFLLYKANFQAWKHRKGKKRGTGRAVGTWGLGTWGGGHFERRVEVFENNIK